MKYKKTTTKNKKRAVDEFPFMCHDITEIGFLLC